MCSDGRPITRIAFDGLELLIEPTPEHLHVRLEGRIDRLQTWISAFAQLGKAAVAHERNRLLVDFRALEGGQSVIDDFELASRLHGLGLLGRRIALIERPEYWDETQFFATAAINRGVRIRLFADEATAEAWLLEN